MSNIPYRHIEEISDGVYQYNEWTIHYDFKEDSILEIVNCKSEDTNVILNIDEICSMFRCYQKHPRIDVGFMLMNPSAKLSIICQRGIKEVRFKDDFDIECDTLEFESLICKTGSVILNGHVNVNHLILPANPFEETYWPMQPLLIGPNVFKGSSLQDICNTDCISFIGREAFADCKELKRVYLKVGVTDIQPKAFKNSGVERIEIINTPYNNKFGRFTKSAFDDTPAHAYWLELRSNYKRVRKMK